MTFPGRVVGEFPTAIRHKDRGDPRMKSGWNVAECTDGGQRVLLAAHEDDIYWVPQVLTAR